MRQALWARLRDARYALPGKLGPMLPEAGAEWAAALARPGRPLTFGYFAPDGAVPAEILSAYRALSRGIAAGGETYLSVKAPQFGFDPAALGELAALGHDLVFDAHAPHQAEATLDLARALHAGCVIPARWARSGGDAADWRERPGRVRLVKGEWADPAGDPANLNAAYLALVDRLAGRSAPVAVATHDPVLARAALIRLKAAGTPCELEQLRGLPHRRSSAVAAELGVRVRSYVPFGPGWWPYAIDKALARPYLARWWVEDWLGVKPGRAPAAA